MAATSILLRKAMSNVRISGNTAKITSRGMAGYAENVCDLIGQTPMVKVMNGLFSI